MKWVLRMVLMAGCLVSAAMAAPNVVVIIADDMGWGDLGIHGNGNVRTPNLDRLAEGGVRFDRFFVDPVCAPTRAALLTGRWARRSGVTGVTRGAERMSLAEVTLADVFRQAGYATGCFGKWHNGSAYPYHPMGRGFDEFLGFCCGHWGDYIDPPLERNGEAVKTKGFIADVFTDAAIQFVEKEGGKPFFCWLSFCTPHSPFEVTNEDWKRTQGREMNQRNRDPKKENATTTRAALSLVENLDRNVGRLLSALDRLGLRDNTVVVFLSDNGPNSWRWNDGMRGKKGSVDEGGVRVPFVLSWPGKLPTGMLVKEPAAHVDLMPTLCALTGVTRPDGVALNGVDLTPVLKGEDLPERSIFTSWGKKASVRTGQWRATKNELHDMLKDPGQREDLSVEQAEVHRELLEQLDRYLKETKAEVVPGPIPVGHAGFPVSLLPAQDAKLEGEGLRFSSIHPNASWVTGWTKTTMSVGWDIEVVLGGTYEVELQITAPPRAVGLEVVVESGAASLTCELKESFDPEEQKPLDRVPRSESAHKEFHDWKVGTLDLAAGRQRMVVTIPTMPDGTGLDLRSLRLRRAEPE